MELLGNCLVVGNSPFLGDLEPGRTTRAVGWLERLESLEMQLGPLGPVSQKPQRFQYSSCHVILLMWVLLALAF